jgi:hypothetical protein
MKLTAVKDNDFPFADSRAARMLSDGFARASSERNKSLRSIGRDLGYKQPTVLSHMATGRAPIPLDRAVDIAKAVGLKPSDFVAAVVEQKSPTAAACLADWGSAALPGPGLQAANFAASLEAILGFPVESLTAEQEQVLREVVLDPRPTRRWLSAAELPVMIAIREAAPCVTASGLSKAVVAELKQVLSATQ